MDNAGQGGVGRRRAFTIAVVVASTMLAVPVAANAVGRTVRAHAGRDAAKPFFDSRVAARRAGPQVATSASERVARAQLRSSLGRQGVVQVDPLTGTVRTVQKLNGTLTGPAAGDRADVAMRWVRSNRAALGLTTADVDALTLSDRVVAKGSGVTHLRYRQAYRGIPAFDNDLRVNLDRGGRILNVTGGPVSGLSVSSIVPKLDAVAAMRALQRNVGVERAINVTSGPGGARQVTNFARGDFARLVLFNGADGPLLAWHLTYKATSVAYYDAVVDANTGEVLYRQNLTKFDADETVWPNYPGAEEEPAPKGPANAPIAVNFETEGWLTNELTLNGPFAHAYSDVNNDDTPQGSEEITRANDAADFPDAGDFQEFFPPPNVPPAPPPPPRTEDWDNSCDFTTPDPEGWPDPIATKARCSWDPTDDLSWQTNREQNGTQAFYLANTFHDHLERPEIGFDAASGNFEGADKVELNTDDGAATNPNGGPDGDHLNNANMSTPPDGQSPLMQMYLFANDPDPQAFFEFRNINGGDAASILWHEYTHGLSNRLVTNADDSGAVSSPHAGAMGEAWSDWYALDLLHREGLEFDDPNFSGQVDVGVYSDARFASIRFEPIDCPVNSVAPRCPGGFFTGHGGYTLGDFGHVAATLDEQGNIVPIPEVHSDGEIWAQTLWDLRTRLIDFVQDEETGSDIAEALITEAMRLSPPEPSYLDMRNSILAAEQAITSNANIRGIVWEVFAGRGMGFFASAVDSSDITPTENFSVPPDPGGPTGTTTGSVTSADTGLPLGNVTVGFGGLVTDQTFPDYLATKTATSGRYTLTAPVGRYGDLVFQAPGYNTVSVADFTVSSGSTRTQNAVLRRDWAALRGGALITSTTDDTGADFGCGAKALIDQQQGAGWSANNPDSPNAPPDITDPPTAVIQLPQAITINAFGLDPSHTCGDGPDAATKDYRIETSPDGVHFAVAKQGTFGTSAIGKLNIVAPTANATNVRFIRLTLLSPQDEQSPADFIDFSELEVFGGAPNVLPKGSLVASPDRVAPRKPVTFDASSFTDPDSKITGYDWDFDGNGSVDRTTSTPTTTFAYSRAGTFTAKVMVKDFRGGAGTATDQVRVTRGPRATLPKRGTNGRAKVRVSCAVRCTVRAKFIRKGKTLGSLKRSFTGTKRLTVKLSKKARRSIHSSSVKVTLVVTVRYTDGRKTTKRGKVTLTL